MLVLTRKMNEEIRIGEEIVIKVLDIRGNCVRIGVEAPREVSVMRSELVTGKEGAMVPALAVGSTAARIKATPPEVSHLPCASRTCDSERPPQGRSTLAALVSRQRRKSELEAIVHAK